MCQRFLNGSISALLILFTVFAIGCHKEEQWETVFSDNFNRADGNPGSDWVVDAGANASLAISGNRVLYTSADTTDNSVVFYQSSGIKRSRFRISAMFVTGADASVIESAGFIFEPDPEIGTSFSATFSGGYLAIGKTDKATDVYTPLSSMVISLDNNAVYYLRLAVDGPNVKCYMEDSNHVLIHELSADLEAHSAWSTYNLLMSNAATTMMFDNYLIEEFND